MLKIEMATVSSEADMAQKPFLVHFLICSYLLEASDLTLITAAQHSDGKPVLVLGCASGVVKATCYVPNVIYNLIYLVWIMISRLFLTN